MDLIHHWTDERTGLRPLQLVDWLRLPRSKCYHWREYYRITDRGRRALNERRQKWQMFRRALNILPNTR